MANRSYIYLKNGDETRILTEGIYTIPYFQQLFWDEEDLRAPISLWKTAEKLEEDEEQAEKFYQEQNVDILLPIEKFQQHALQNRSFLEENAPQALQLYDAFVRYILANVKDGDMLGFDVLEVIFMDQVSTASDKLLKNIRAIQENQPKDLDFSLTDKNIIGLAMGFPDYYASELLPEDNILASVAYQDELNKTNPQDDKQGDDLTGADTKANKWRNGIVYLLILALVIRLIFYMMVKRQKREYMRIADYSVTKAVLERHGFTFKKSFGQNFLTDTNILQKIVDTAEVDDQVNVIEIGPGIGALTEFLAERAAEVMAFEIDHRLVPILADTLRDFDNVTVVNEDILKVDLAQHIQNFKNPDLPIKVVANLPYYITTPILMHLIESGIPFSEFVVMMQKEVADRISAKPNTKAYGSLSIAVQYYMTAKVAFIVPRTVFVPAPNVDSAILKMVRRPEPAVAVKDENFFFKVSKASFTHRRKTLWNNLTGYFGKTDEVKDKLIKALDQAGLSPSVRGEALGLEEFASLADALKGQGL